MLFPALITVYCLLFALITYYRFHLGLFFLFLLLPTYLIRFNLGPLPTTLLEVMVWIILIIWIIHAVRYKKITGYWLLVTGYFKRHKTLFFSIFLFLIAATISIFTSVDLRSALGEWKAFYIEPFLIFIILITTLKDNKQKLVTRYPLPVTSTLQLILFALVLSGLATSILAIYQHFTGFMVPWDFWKSGRVTGWYGFPNAVGLFLAPIVPLALYLLVGSYKKLKQGNWILDFGFWILFVFCIFLLLADTLAVIFAKSTGALIGIVAGISILLLLYKKTRLVTLLLLIVCFLLLVFLPSNNPIKQELTFQNRSGQIRISMWGEATQFLSNNPIRGAGLTSYSTRITPYHTTVNGEGIAIFHHPHNLFLTIWINLGIMGLLGFVWLLVWFYKVGFSNYKHQMIPFLISAMTVTIVTGLVDTPYIKNDLAILFWLLPALLLVSSYDVENFEA
jgi:O-antigen ligase